MTMSDRADAVPAGTAKDSGRLWRVLFWLGLVVALLAAFLFSLASGRYVIPIRHVIGIMSSHLVDVAVTWSPPESMVVQTVRLPRVLMTAVAGAGLSLCGAVLQGIFRNPLVGPQTIGAASGSAARRDPVLRFWTVGAVRSLCGRGRGVAGRARHPPDR